MALDDHEAGRIDPRAHEADQAGRDDDDREIDVEEEDADEGGGRDGVHSAVLERAPADAQDGLDDHGQHGGLDAVEDRLDDRDILEAGVEIAEPQHDQGAGQHEEDAGHDAARRAVQQPADIGGKLGRLRTGQQHAVIERVEEPALADPVPLVDQHAVHHGDLAGRAAEAEQPDPEPDAERLAEADAVPARGIRVLASRGRAVIGHVPPRPHAAGGQPWLSPRAWRAQA